MYGAVRAWWLNALIVTTVLWMWATIAGGIYLGVELAKAESDAASVPTYSYETSDCTDANGDGYYYDSVGDECTP